MIVGTCWLAAGRDGLTHNMLENIHSHWKRKRVCKIKCKGVCTVDMDNICQQLEVVSSFLLPFGSVVCVSPAAGIMIINTQIKCNPIRWLHRKAYLAVYLVLVNSGDPS